MTSVQEFVDSRSDAELLPSGKVRCTSTGHEMPARLEVISQYWAGSKYASAKARATYDFAQHEPWIVAHKQASHLLYCTLTRQPLSKLPKAIEGHVQGKRYQRLLKEAKEGTAKPTGKRQQKKWRHDQADQAGDAADEGGGGGSEGGGGGSESGEAEDDAAEFIAEGAFWERDDKEQDEGDANQEEDPDAFWTRPKTAAAAGSSKKSKRKEKRPQPQSHKDSSAATSAISAEDEVEPPADGKSVATGKRKMREPTRGQGAPPVKFRSKRVS